MLFKESLWFKKILGHHAQSNDIVLNIGSSTRQFREQVQPHIHRNVFDPLRIRNIRVYHIDCKSDQGVDLVGDVTDRRFIQRLQRFHPTLAICSNLLEHLENRTLFCNELPAFLPSGGKLIVSVPYQYPYHPDPIDTLFRPTVEELAELFPSMKIIESTILDCGTLAEKQRYERQIHFFKWLIRKLKSLIRLFLPFYKWSEWHQRILGRNRTNPALKCLVTCVVFQKL